MSKPKWTPGPWLIRDQDKRTGCPYVGPVDQDVATIHSCPGETATLANARLIAAAPTLYAALEALLERYQADAGDDTPAVAQAQAALKAARGDS